MNILDENVAKPQRELLQARGIAVRQVGVTIGRAGLLDEEIITMLHSLRRPTFFTRDSDFYGRLLCHRKYCLVYLSVEKSEVASFVRRLLRHPEFKTEAKRMGSVVRVSHSRISCWRRHSSGEEHVEW